MSSWDVEPTRRRSQRLNAPRRPTWPQGRAASRRPAACRAPGDRPQPSAQDPAPVVQVFDLRPRATIAALDLLRAGLRADRGEPGFSRTPTAPGQAPRGDGPGETGPGRLMRVRLQNR